MHAITACSQAWGDYTTQVIDCDRNYVLGVIDNAIVITITVSIQLKCDYFLM